MLKKTIKISLISLLVVAILLIMAYCGLAYYFKDGFSYGTYINGIYCTGKSIEEVNASLLNGIGNYEGLTIVSGDGKSYNIASSDVFLKYDYTNRLKGIFYNQHPILWGLNLIGDRKNLQITPDITYNNEIFDELIYDLPFMSHVNDNNRVVKINKTLNNGYELINQRQDVLNEEYAKEIITEAFNNFESSIDLRQMGCYRNLSMNDNMLETIKLFDKIDKFQNRNIVYLFGDDKEVIDKSVAYRFITTDSKGKFVLDDNGNLVVDEDAVLNYVDELCEKYNTYGCERKFKTTQGRTVSVTGGNYGNKIDDVAEKEYLLNAIKENINEEHEPEYEYQVGKKGLNDLGETYIEIDLTEQRMYYYEEGKMKIATDVVTGCLANGHSTIRGTYYIYNHRKDTVLIGPDYQSFVHYWLGIFKGYGIHDASWRNKFGGEIYKTSGSHGCVNTPYDKVKKMWEIVEDGTPCVVFY